MLANRIATDAEAEAKAVRFAADAEAARIAVEAKAEAVAARKIAAEAAPFIVLLCSHLNANRLRENSTSFWVHAIMNQSTNYLKGKTADESPPPQALPSQFAKQLDREQGRLIKTNCISSC